jgi:hypothetical protein
MPSPGGNEKRHQCEGLAAVRAAFYEGATLYYGAKFRNLLSYRPIKPNPAIAS